MLGRVVQEAWLRWLRLDAESTAVLARRCLAAEIEARDLRARLVEANATIAELRADVANWRATARRWYLPDGDF